MMTKRLSLILVFGLTLALTWTYVSAHSVAVQPVNGLGKCANSETACRLVGDFDHDYDIDIDDIMMVAQLWRRQEGDPGFDRRFDLHPNGVINVVDIMRVATNWGTRKHMFFGVNMFGGDINDAAVMSMAQEAEICWVMHGLSWSGVEPNPPNQNGHAYNWSVYDASFRTVYDAGMNLFVVIGSNPSWAASTSCGPIDQTPMSNFTDFVRAAVERYDGDGLDDAPGSPQVAYWAFYNEADFDPDHSGGEPGHGGCWGNNGAAYGEMLRQAYRAVKEADPYALVAFSPIAHDRFTYEARPPGYDSVYSREGPFSYLFTGDVLEHLHTNYGSEPDFPFFDAMNFHFYNDFRNAWDGPNQPYDQDLLGKQKFIRDTWLQPYGLQDLPFVVSEVGVPSAPTDDWTNRSEALSSDYLPQVFVRALAGNFRLAIYFTMRDFPDPYQYGLLASDNTPRQSYYAYDVLTDQLGGTQYDRQLSPAETGSSEIEAHKVITGDGVEMIIAWTDNGERIGRKGYPPVTRTMQFNASHFSTWTGRLRVVDKLGTEQIMGSGGAFVDVQITQDPKYISVAP